MTFYWPWPLSNDVWLSSTPHLDNRWVRPKRRRRRRRRRPANNKSSPGAAPPPPSKREVSETRHCSTPKEPFDEDTLVNMNVSGSHGSEKEEECCDVGSEFEALSSALSSDNNNPSEASGSDESSVVDLASYPLEELEYDQRGREAGVRFKKDGCARWTPIKRVVSESETSESGGSEICFKNPKEKVLVDNIGGHPVLISRGCVITPIAARTRKKTKIKNIK